MTLFWYLFVFLLGAIVGSFLNVAIARLPFEKSLLWPSSRCGRCQQPIAWYDNIPLLSYWILRGRCRPCGAGYSIRYFWIELLTALGFLCLFELEVVRNIHRWRAPMGMMFVGGYPLPSWIGFGYHAVLFSFLMVTSGCDLQGRNIPLSVTVTGTIFGLIGATLMPWPWPSLPEAATPLPPPGFPVWAAWRLKEAAIGAGIYAWPVWGPLPSILAPGGNWQTGLLTGLAGAAVGTFMMRTIGFCFSRGLGKDALGLGDADLMMMAGAFLGWQLIPVALFLSVPFALVVGLFNFLLRRDTSLPFGPSLSGGILLAMLGWRWIGNLDGVRLLFFWGELLGILVALAVGFLFVAGFAIGFLKGKDHENPHH